MRRDFILYFLIFFIFEDIIQIEAKDRIVFLPDGFFSVEKKVTLQGHTNLDYFELKEIPPTIDPDSFIIKSLSEDLKITGTFIKNAEEESIYQFLKKIIDQSIEIIDTEDHSFRGRIIKVLNDGIVLKQEVSLKNFFILFSHIKAIQYPDYIINEKPFILIEYSNSRVSADAIYRYKASGIFCQPEFLIFLNERDSTLSFEARFKIKNYLNYTLSNENAFFLDAEFSKTKNMPMVRMMATENKESFQDEDESQTEKVLEYRLFKIPGKIILFPQDTILKYFCSKEKIKYEKSFYFNISQNEAVFSRITFTNTFEETLPKARYLIFTLLSNNITPAGEVTMDRVLKKEPLKILPGIANDIKIKRVETDNKKVSDRLWEKSVEFTINNSLNTSAKLEIEENLYGFWEIISSSIPFKKNSSTSISFEPIIKPQEKVVVSYTVRYKQ